jgi:hypothetical protein
MTNKVGPNKINTHNFEEIQWGWQIQLDTKFEYDMQVNISVEIMYRI